jgi:hypothetical protein
VKQSESLKSYLYTFFLLDRCEININIIRMSKFKTIYISFKQIQRFSCEYEIKINTYVNICTYIDVYNNINILGNKYLNAYICCVTLGYQ